ncbi:hypothetical protein BC830DRAFT_1119375 [Chytriomyces sp. MP71]|nr:hypothetical protein BC830DRAFT_1119375 [Chytriomyces sp. MP71]
MLDKLMHAVVGLFKKAAEPVISNPIMSSSPSQSPSPATAKRVGRKRDETEPASKKAALNRANQRAYKERQVQKLASLQAQVDELRAVAEAKTAETATLREAVVKLQNATNPAKPVSSSAVSLNLLLSCDRCAAHIDRIAALESNVVSLQSQLSAALLVNQSATAPFFGFTYTFGSQETGGAMTFPDSQLGSTTPDSSMAAARTDSSPSIYQGIGVTESEWIDVFNASSGSSHLTATSEQLFGPMKVEFTRYAFRCIPSLMFSEEVDTLMNLMAVCPTSHVLPVQRKLNCKNPTQAQTRTTDKNRIKKLMIKSLTVWHKMLDACKKRVVDLNQAMEVYFAFQSQNTDHLEFLMGVMAEAGLIIASSAEDDEPHEDTLPMNTEERIVPPQGLELCNALKQIPSLSKAFDLIDELCILFCRSRVSGNSYVQTGSVISRLHKSCIGYDDRAQFVSALMAFKDANKEKSDMKLEAAIQDLDCMGL